MLCPHCGHDTEALPITIPFDVTGCAPTPAFAVHLNPVAAANPQPGLVTLGNSWNSVCHIVGTQPIITYLARGIIGGE